MCALHNRTPWRAAKVQLTQSILSQHSTAPLYLYPLGPSTFMGDCRPFAMHWDQLSSWCSASAEDRSMHRFALFSLCLFLSQQKHSLCWRTSHLWHGTLIKLEVNWRYGSARSSVEHAGGRWYINICFLITQERKTVGKAKVSSFFAKI